VENATSTTFADASVRGASLQCAYEMFAGDDDKRFLSEVARILKPGGRVVILPLYTHTHYCAYASPEYYGKGRSDPDAKEYVRLDVVGIPSSRKYDPTQLKHWVLDRIVSLGMTYRLRALRSKSEFGAGVYCHFVLEITR
jgi:ubiquinone/menaquinone biosynthesis C-methylase UbiE